MHPTTTCYIFRVANPTQSTTFLWIVRVVHLKLPHSTISSQLLSIIRSIWLQVNYDFLLSVFPPSHFSSPIFSSALLDAYVYLKFLTKAGQ
jgi:hypothetical protein